MPKPKKQLRTILKGKETGRLKRDEVLAAILHVLAEKEAARRGAGAFDPRSPGRGGRRSTGHTRA